MIPVVTAEMMRAADAACPDGEDVLIARAGWAVAREAKRMLGGTYGRRVVVVAGKGNNGADGRRAADILRSAGAAVRIVDAETRSLPDADLVIDAAFGIGFRGDYCFPEVGDSPVLAVDIPSGVHADTGEATDAAATADRTVAFAALKPGHLFGVGAAKSGTLTFVDIGVEAPNPHAWLLEQQDVVSRLGRRSREAHKWQSSVLVVAGSPGMIGAAVLATKGAARAGAGIVHLALPGVSPGALPIGDMVTHALDPQNWADVALSLCERMRALVIGPGLGRSDATVSAIRRVIAEADIPIVVDADGLYALGDGAVQVLRDRSNVTVLTPHDRELEYIAGRPVRPDRIATARDLAEQLDSIVLLKGATTTVAAPDGTVLLASMGGPRLATAGTGDVLAGVVGAFLARGLDPELAAASGAYVHGAASRLGFGEGLVASDLPDAIAKWLSGAMMGADV